MGSVKKLDTCIFCDIIEGKIPSTERYIDEFVYAFDNIYINKGIYRDHILIIPKIHISSTSSISNDEENLYYLKAHEAVLKIAKQLNVQDYKIIINSGSCAGQIIFHLHIHLCIPLEGTTLNQ
jgi:histidine triad (HIT) family protein